MEAYIIEIIVYAILLFYPAWRIFKRAGLNPALSLTVLIPAVGMFVGGLILALSTWKLNARPEGDK